MQGQRMSQSLPPPPGCILMSTDCPCTSQLLSSPSPFPPSPKPVCLNESSCQCWLQGQTSHGAAQVGDGPVNVQRVKHVQLTQSLTQGRLTHTTGAHSTQDMEHNTHTGQTPRKSSGERGGRGVRHTSGAGSGRDHGRWFHQWYHAAHCVQCRAAAGLTDGEVVRGACCC